MTAQRTLWKLPANDAGRVLPTPVTVEVQHGLLVSVRWEAATRDHAAIEHVAIDETPGDAVPVRAHAGAAQREEEARTDALLADEALRQLEQYFLGEREAFDLPLSPVQRFGWEQLKALRYGELVTYSELARRAGSPKAARAAGTACSTNPLPIVVPCHRVVPSGGGIGRYAGGVAWKRWLLELEAGA